MTLQTKIGSAAAETAETLERLGVDASLWTGGSRVVRSPVTGEAIGHVHDTSPAAVAAAIEAALGAGVGAHLAALVGLRAPAGAGPGWPHLVDVARLVSDPAAASTLPASVRSTRS